VIIKLQERLSSSECIQWPVNEFFMKYLLGVTKLNVVIKLIQ
jgi:hypothetical protein